MRATPCGPGRRYPQIGKGPRDRKHRQSPARRALPRAGAPRPRRCHGDVRAHARAASRCPRRDAATSTRSAVFLAALACFPLVARRRSPLGVFALTAAASADAQRASATALGPPFGPTVALFFVAADERTRHHVRRTGGRRRRHLRAPRRRDSDAPTPASRPAPILFGVVVWGGAWVLGDRCACAAAQRRGRGARRRAPSGTPSASAGWRPPRSARGSPATCTTRPATRST